MQTEFYEILNKNEIKSWKQGGAKFIKSKTREVPLQIKAPQAKS